MSNNDTKYNDYDNVLLENALERKTRKEPKSINSVSVSGIFIMIFGAICYSVLVAMIKWASNMGYGSMQILVFKSFIQIMVAIPLSLLKCTKSVSIKCGINELKTNIKNMDKKLWIFILFRGIFGAITSIFYFEAITKLPIGDAMSLYSMYPVPTTFVAYFILKEHISYKYIISLILCIIGTFLIIHPDFIFGDDIGRTNSQNNIIIGYIAAILSAVWMSGVFIFIRLAKKAPPTILIIVQGMSCIVEGVIIGFIFQHFYGLYSLNDYICLLTIGIIGYCAQWSLTKASQILPAALSSILRSTEILWTYLWQIIIFHEMPSYLTVIGAFTILFAIVTVTLEKIKQKNASNSKQRTTQQAIITEHSINK